MYVLITYDIATSATDGPKRLRQMAKACEDMGQRVQNSVFEVKADPAQWTLFKARLLEIADLSQDSLRFYYLGRNWQRKVEHHGSKPSFDIDGPLIL
ncbi:CRISPR-associated endonuclease Cas2 [Rubinisphaera brasiliensis]|uniref:CRISPR-associated endoribonuclease Cas2 n=1 Tax=Rubinisphaera brasiliensis (strain ATCC 49424 / DSM 5305 / JCM 21570 / IAM 15109 / NBRC 103401 / IFAM 1448) TaxID=756272 RepID=F0SHD1_RUBBR|nr:CRISPR-associated endonuclease Cas2 [Rubinisphaera brasiliensis]ADY61445.1 CRISPR-associated protein, Cas2 family [Rubinisphaera brasiliensis DSM 5305]ADY61686.1 CRISPR-associated protein, Cas2 family [Rubinisphaera brasiliensis DSM 5305]